MYAGKKLTLMMYLTHFNILQMRFETIHWFLFDKKYFYAMQIIIYIF